MKTHVLLKAPISDGEHQKLKDNFLQYSMDFALSEPLTPHEREKKLSKAEIYFGKEFDLDHLELMQSIKWIHLQSSFINNYKFKMQCDQRNILITHSRTVEATNIAEYVLSWSNFLMKGLDGCLLKNEALIEPSHCQDKRFLQIGLGSVGSEIARLAKVNAYKVWGIRKRGPSFHPHCNKIYSLDQLHSLLSTSDVVCCALSKDKLKASVFNRASLQHMKKGAILIFLNNCELVDLKDLKLTLQKGDLKAAVFDSTHPLLQSVKDIEGVFITPAIAAHPLGSCKRALDIFQRNLRHFIYGNFSKMSNLS
ncbi:hypothetical protein AB751O23_AG_00260 [Chlamydiales bacterium SCGC AB-751-O23]|jgi:phosphoglycerate dehydrogenase-like enzyme|nr:hypothetical protein AB751O23_AG_00260 [Chlamydiales bacterium SCGC AB-751-O23]